ncbi:MAG: hypothetical protein JNK75_11475, partial [Betaproteobacteria bacterium]|nr:hypothetical protein [Betaproteobacteria bacterium]
MKPISDAVLASTLFTAVQAVAMAPEPAAMGGEVLPCRGPVISVIVVDDAVSASPMLVDKWRQFKVASPASAVRSVLEDSGCVMVLDNDPVFAAISGTAQPEAVLRVR